MIVFSTSRKKQTPKALMLSLITTGVMAVAFEAAVLAQVTPDSSLAGESSTVTPNVDIEGISSDLIQGGATRGNSLFHSFENFSIRTGEGAYFSPPDNIDLILGRVTGSLESQISGTLGVLGGADLFLLNPNGIQFGAGASLDLNGSFLASTAESVFFPNGVQFEASNPSVPPLLEIGMPIGLQFGSQAGAVRLLPGSSLDFNSGQTLALLGNRVSVRGSSIGSIIAPSARVEIGSIADNNQVRLQSISQGWAVNYTEVNDFSNILVTQALVDVSESDLFLRGENITLNNGGGVFSFNLTPQTGGLFSIEASETLRIESSNLINVTFAEGNAGRIEISAKNLIVDAGLLNTDSGNDPFFGNAPGDGGDQSIRTSESVQILNNSIVSTGTSTTGNSGDIDIQTGQLVIDGDSRIQSQTAGPGDAGQILIDTDQLSITNNSVISAEAISPAGGLVGSSGSIIITNVENAIIANDSEISAVSESTRPAVDIELEAATLTLADRGLISAETTSSQGGNINLTVDNLLSFQGNDNQISATSSSGGNDGAGNITIDAGIIAALPGGNNDITANASGGSGGRIVINTQGIFGFQELTLEELQSLLPGVPEPTPDKLQSNDITAISQSGDPELSGQVIFNTPETDPSDSTAELSERIDIPPKLAQRCRPGQALDNGEFANVGNGGLPPTPDSLRSYPAVWHDLRPPKGLQQASTNPKLPKATAAPANTPIIEAKGWVTTDKGLMLVAPKKSPANTSLIASGAC